jgi:two-component system chemotaxis response regulator CheY
MDIRYALIVDDLPEVRSHYESMLHNLGFAIIEASDGQEALNLIEDADTPNITVIFLDYNMPGTNGLFFLNAYSGTIPVVMMSTDEAKSRICVQLHGASTWIPKYASKEEIVSCLFELGLIDE